MRVVFVPGFTQGPASWRPVTAHVDGAELAAVPDGLDFVATAHALNHGRARYVGYSMGGRLCLQLALDHPDVIERLALISASPGIDDPAERAARRERDEQLALEIERHGIDAFLERWLAQPMFASLPRERAAIDDRRVHHTVATLAHQLRALGQGEQPSNWQRLVTLPMPVLLVAGALDAKYVEIAHRMAEAIPNARVELVAGAGHACHLEQPERVAHLLASW